MEVFYATDEVKEFVLSGNLPLKKESGEIITGAGQRCGSSRMILISLKENWLPNTTSFRAGRNQFLQFHKYRQTKSWKII